MKIEIISFLMCLALEDADLLPQEIHKGGGNPIGV